MESKKLLLEKAKNMLNNKIPLDKKWLLEFFFILHHQWYIKKGCGIKDIFIQKNNYGKNGFYLLRNDGSITDISIYTCINKPNNKKYIIQACRNAIRDSILRFKKNNFIPNISICDNCKCVLNIYNIHIDHYNIKFKDIFNLWIKNKNIYTLYNEKINNTSLDLEEQVYFIDDNIKNDFINFHNDIATLRLLCSSCNLKIK